MIKATIIGAAGLIALAAWGTSPKTMSDIQGMREAGARDRAVELVKRKLKDPASAKFSTLTNRPAAVCGLVNARNSFGGFTGWQVFVVTDAGAAINQGRIYARYCQ